MAGAQAGSIAAALITAMNPHPFSRYVNYLGAEDGMTWRDFEMSVLSEYYNLDMSYCHRGKRLYPGMLYEIYGSYSGQTGDVVRDLMLNKATCSQANKDYYDRAGFICLQMKGLTFDEWLEQQVRKSSKGDEMSVYILSHLFMRHTMIHTKNKAWCSILPTGGNVNYAAACQTHLLYMGNSIFGLLVPKPPPMSSSVQNQIPAVSICTTMMNVQTRLLPRSLYVNPLKPQASAALGAPPPPPAQTLANQNVTTPDTPSTKNSTPVMENTTDGDKEAQRVEADKDDELSLASTIVINDGADQIIKVSATDVLNKECSVKLKPLSTDLIKKYCKSVVTDRDNNDADSDNVSDQDITPNTEAIKPMEPDDVRGCPKRRTKRVSYEESSPESGGDSDFNERPKKVRKSVPSSGPSMARLHAHAYAIGNKGNLHQSAKPSLPLRYPKRSKSIQLTENKSDGAGTIGNNGETPTPDIKSKQADVKSPSSEKSKPGTLDVMHHGLKRPKKIRKFRCKLCNVILYSRKEANDHHKKKHGKCYCNVCGHRCNTPSTLERHMYSHSEKKDHVCRTCGEAFRFEGEWKQHRFKHRRIAAFPCPKCPKRFMREGERTKHLKTHENILHSCEQCKYSTNDPCNLKQHRRVHTDDEPYLCMACNRTFKYWMQKQRHVCKLIRSSSLEFD